MTNICNFPISRNRRCKQPITDDKPNCGRHSTELSADQLGKQPTIYKKGDELHVWAGEPDGVYCLIHDNPAYQVLYQLAGEKAPCCLRESAVWTDENKKWHREDGPAIIRTDGTQEWYWHNELHREDGPAIIRTDGTQEWYWHGKWHRDGGPAIIKADGTQIWCQHGEVHREDGPAVIEADGTQEWWQHDELHREGGPAEVKPDGTQIWRRHDEIHRDDGPAWIEPDGTQLWFRSDNLHRDDDPAVIRSDGTQEWWWHGRKVTEQEHAAFNR